MERGRFFSSAPLRGESRGKGMPQSEIRDSPLLKMTHEKRYQQNFKIEKRCQSNGLKTFPKSYGLN